VRRWGELEGWEVGKRIAEKREGKRSGRRWRSEVREKGGRGRGEESANSNRKGRGGKGKGWGGRAVKDLDEEEEEKREEKKNGRKGGGEDVSKWQESNWGSEKRGGNKGEENTTIG